MTDEVLASVIVPTCGRPQLFQDTVRSLQRQAAPRFEILVVDNAPCDEVRRCVASMRYKHGPHLTYVPEPEVGLDRSRHAGARAARGEILVYVDDDVIVPQGWLQALLGPYRDPKVACAGGKTEALWHCHPPDWIEPLKGWLSIFDLGEKRLELSSGQSVVGCNFSVRRRVLYEVGGFNPDDYHDPDMIWYSGDGEVGLVRKVIQAGYRVIYEPRAWLYHRVTENRMTPQYFRHRTFVEGIRDGYTEFRRAPVGRAALIADAARQGVCWTWHCVRRCFTAGDRTRRVQREMVRSYRKARMLYDLHLAAAADLRRHVLRSSYLTESPQQT